MHCDLHTSIPDWIIDYPETSAVFNALGLDVSCGGKSLEYVCQQQGLSPSAVFDRLEQAIAAAEREGGQRRSSAPGLAARLRRTSEKESGP